MGQITVYSGPERRRRWSEDERRLILTEAFSPGACVAEVARRHDVSTALVYTWRRKLLEAAAEPNVSVGHDPGFAEARIGGDGEGMSADRAPAMIIDLARGKRVSIFASASPALVGAALKALR
ncbi:IS66-like element accessory protein TnpA [Thauera propionica]|uniref:IS66-like element accessory protein TnpA n=1 Tax=Thauera propionica TaxID=2019431 RepID=UPI0023F19690|nr:transposase [Thauera propionica]MDD3677391.1 transposase [Thauera propionica]